jgi:hypothetical protein
MSMSASVEGEGEGLPRRLRHLGDGTILMRGVNGLAEVGDGMNLGLPVDN